MKHDVMGETQTHPGIPLHARPNRAPGSCREKARVRFAKEGALRFIGHQDLLHLWNRWCRRAGIPVRFSEGFHPAPRFSSPLALPLGVVGLEEVLEFELVEPMADAELTARLRRHAEPGIAIVSLERLPLRHPTEVVAVEYRCPLPADRTEAARSRAATLAAAASIPVVRRHPKKPPRTYDLKSLLLSIAIEDDAVRFRLRVARTGAARPEEVLAALELSDLLTAGAVITRTRVELSDQSSENQATPGAPDLEEETP